MPVATKFFDNYTRLDDENRMVAHFCHEGDCAHCKVGVPFGFPDDDGYAQLSDRTLGVLAGRAHKILAAIEKTRAERGR